MSLRGHVCLASARWQAERADSVCAAAHHAWCTQLIGDRAAAAHALLCLPNAFKAKITCHSNMHQAKRVYRTRAIERGLRPTRDRKCYPLCTSSETPRPKLVFSTKVSILNRHAREMCARSPILLRSHEVCERGRHQLNVRSREVSARSPSARSSVPARCDSGG